MNHSEKITIILSGKTMNRLKRLEKKSGISYRKHINKAIHTYITLEEKKHTYAAQMKAGYRQMASLNRELANRLPGVDDSDIQSI